MPDRKPVLASDPIGALPHVAKKLVGRQAARSQNVVSRQLRFSDQSIKLGLFDTY
jgi:hypothetical protein